jgi:hypothetical protein
MPADKCLSAAVSYCTVALQTALFVGVVVDWGVARSVPALWSLALRPEQGVVLCKSQGVSLNRHTLKATRGPGQPLLDMARDRAAEYSSASSNCAEVLQLPAPTLASTSLQRTHFEASPW